MSNRIFFVSIALVVGVAILISLAPDEKWDSLYEEIAARSGILLDTILKLLAIFGLVKYLFLEQRR